MEKAQAPHNSDVNSYPKPQIIYRCKKCRRIVASEEQIVPHEPKEGKKCFKWKKRSNDPWDKEQPPQCSSIFVEPMKWMQVVEEGCIQDKLQCLGCKARLGYFNWAGMQCNCGAWINPAFQLHKSRLDECSLSPLPEYEYSLVLENDQHKDNKDRLLSLRAGEKVDTSMPPTILPLAQDQWPSS